MKHLAFDPRKNNSYNRIALTVTPPAPDGVNARVFDTGLGIFFEEDVIVKHNDTPLVKGIDYVITGYSKHLKHTANLDGFGLIAILSQIAMDSVEVEAHYYGGDYAIYSPVNIPKYVPILGGGVAQILWDNVVDGPMVDSRTLNGVYPEEVKSPFFTLSNLVGLYAERARTQGVPEDKTQIRSIARNLSLSKLAKIPGGLNSSEETVVGALNDVKRQLDEVQTTTKYQATLLESVDLSKETIAVKSGWIAGVDGITVTGRFEDGEVSKVINSGETVTYLPEAGYFVHDVDSTDYSLVKEAWFNDQLPSGVKNVQDRPLQLLQDNVLKLCPWHVPFGGFVSTVRGNLTIPRDADNSATWIIAEENVSVTYWDGVKWAVEAQALGTVIWWDNKGDLCRLYTQRKLGREPLLDNGVNTIDEINKLKESIDTTGLTVGSVLETFRTVDPNFAIPLGSAPVSRETYSKLFSAIGETYGAGDGSTTFGVPPVSYGSYRGTVNVKRHPGSVLAKGMRSIAHPTDTNLVYSGPDGYIGRLLESNIITGGTIHRQIIGGLVSVCLSDETGLLYLVSNLGDDLYSYNPATGEQLTIATGINSSINEIFRLGSGDYLLVGDQFYRRSGVTIEPMGAVPEEGRIGGVVGLANDDHFLIAIAGTLYKVSRVTGVSEVITTGITTTNLRVAKQDVSGELTLYDADSGDIYTMSIALDTVAVKYASTVADFVGWLPSQTSNLEWVTTDHLGVVGLKMEPAIPRYVVARAED